MTDDDDEEICIVGGQFRSKSLRALHAEELAMPAYLRKRNQRRRHSTKKVAARIFWDLGDMPEIMIGQPPTTEEPE